MAGLYADAPGRLFPVDRDGSQGFLVNAAGTATALTQANLNRLAGELGNSGTGMPSVSESGTSYVGYVFPQLRNLTGYYFNVEYLWSGGLSLGAMQYSANTTNGTDGAWTNIDSPGVLGQQWSANSGLGLDPKPTFRTLVRACSVTGAKAVRMGIQGSAGNRFWSNLHIYGAIPVATTPDRLTLWHATLDQELAGPALDYSDASRTYTYDKTFRVKNLSATLTANSVLLSTSALTDTSPTVVSQFTISQGAGYASTQTITSIAPGAISAVCTLRLALLSNASLGLWRQRVLAVPNTWT